MAGIYPTIIITFLPPFYWIIPACQALESAGQEQVSGHTDCDRMFTNPFLHSMSHRVNHASDDIIEELFVCLQHGG